MPKHSQHTQMYSQFIQYNIKYTEYAPKCSQYFLMYCQSTLKYSQYIGYIGSSKRYVESLLGHIWSTLGYVGYFGSTLGYVENALAIIAFGSKLVYTRSTYGCCILRFVGSTLDKSGVPRGIQLSTLGVY